MIYTRQFGVALPEDGWVPAPSYILRRALILHSLKKFNPGSVLEIGCGSGALLYDLALRGYYGIGIEESAEALNLAGKVLAGFPSFKVDSSISKLQAESFDYLLSFEVLEHIENDRGALTDWLHLVRRDGIVMLSVPARRSMWDHSDTWAGHFRRYDEEDLREMIADLGLRIESLRSYGWPLANMIKPLRSWVNKRRLDRGHDRNGGPPDDQLARTRRSGIDRSVESKFFGLYSSWIGRRAFPFFSLLQTASSKLGWGTGIIVVARKP